MKKQLNKLTELKEEAKYTTLVERDYNLEEEYEERSEDEERKTLTMWEKAVNENRKMMSWQRQNWWEDDEEKMINDVKKKTKELQEGSRGNKETRAMTIIDEEVMKSKEHRQKNNRTIKEYIPDQYCKKYRSRTPNGCKHVTFFLMSRGLKVPWSQVIDFIWVNYIF